MPLQKLKENEKQEMDEVKGKAVTVFLQSSFYQLCGTWRWSLGADAVFCSDVMLSLPPAFEGTKGIIHPDDGDELKQKFADSRNNGRFRFRIITTYGEVKLLEGDDIKVGEATEQLTSWSIEPAVPVIQEREEKAAYQHLQFVADIYNKTERFASEGIWYYNTATNQTWYSDFIFHLHDLPPQSLNAHLHTFNQFIHPDDADFVTTFIDKSYLERTPLQIEYRIVTSCGEKVVAYKSQLAFSEKGEQVIYGIIQDITAQKTAELETEDLTSLIAFQRQQLVFTEQNAGIGTWQIDLLTRKTTYTDNYYRIFGIKPGSIPSNINSFINFVHPDDQEMVNAAFRKLIYEHAIPDIEYRIIRSDGRTRHISQKAKQITYRSDMIVAGIIEDITVQRMLEKKVAELTEQGIQKTLGQLQSDEMGSMASWIMELESGAITWSEGIHKLLGYKTPVADMSQRTLLSFIHPHDLKKFKDQWNIVVQQKIESVFQLRFLLRGSERFMKAVFRIHHNKEKELFIGTLQDITLENVLQQQLASRVQLAESLTENILDRVIITDINNTVLLWNRAAETAYSVKKEVALGQNFFDLFPHLKSEGDMQLFHKVLKGEKITREGKRSQTGNGYYDLYLMPLWNNAEVTGILHIIHDSTRETERRSNIQERLNFIESLLESSVDRIVALDRNLNYIYWNSRAQDYYGVPKSKVMGRNVLEVFPQIRNDPSFAEFRRALKGETVHLPANIEQRKNFETYLIPIKGAQQEVTGVLWIAHDLTRELHLLQQQEEAQEKLKHEHALVKNAELQNREQSHFIRRVTETVPDMISVMELHTRKINYLNKETFLAHGFDPGEMFTKSPEELRDLIHPDDLPTLQNYYQQFHKIGDEDSVTAEYRAKDFYGHWRWFLVRGKPFQRNAEGNVTHILNVIQNVTERKKTELELQKHFTILQQAENLAQIGSWEFDPVNNTFHWSEGMYRLFDLPKGMGVKPETYLDFAAEEDRAAAKRIIKNLRKDHRSFEEVLYIKKGSHKRQLKVKGMVVTNEKGNVERIVGVDLDMTDMKEAEAKLAESRRWLEQTALVTPDAITVYNLLKKQPFYLNNCLAEWTGYTASQLTEMGIDGRLQLLHPDDRLRLLHFNELMAGAKDGEVKILDYRLTTREGGEMWVHNRSKVFQRDTSGKVTHILTVLQDVTEAKLAEQELRALNSSLDAKNKDLIAKNDEITSFAFVASHDLKEPIRKLHTFTDWLLTREANISQSGISHLNKMINSIRRLDVLIDDIMSLSKAHLSSEKQKQVDLNRVLQMVKEDLIEKITCSGAVIEAANLPHIKGAESMLFSLFQNLVSNAIKFQPKQSTPRVSINAREEIKDGRAGISLLFTDNGIGFTADHAKKIFQIFQRLNVREEYEGTGMGLAICKKIMEKHNGSITAESTTGKGSTFTCWFPS